MTDIFISYSRTDKPWVAKLAGALEAQGYDVWWDPEILPGQDFEEIIKQALNQTKCVITVWSEASIKSKWVKAESNRGLDRNVLIPILYQAVEPPMSFGHIHTADLQNWKGKVEDPRFQQLLKAVSLHTKSPVKPLATPVKKSPWLVIISLIAVVGATMGGYYIWQNQDVPQAMTPASTVEKTTNEEAARLKEKQNKQQEQAEATRLAEEEKAEQEATEKRKAEEQKAKDELAVKQKAEAAKRLEQELKVILAAEAKKKQAEQKPKEELAAKKKAEEAKQKLITNRYLDNADGTITDTKTKLMWKKCSEGLGGNYCSYGTKKEYKWDDAMQQFKKVSFGWHNDWRMPTKEELRTLVYCSNGTPQEEAWDNGCYGKNDDAGEFQRPTINQQAFPNTEDSVFWSSSPYAGGSYSAWHVGFSNGYVGTLGKNAAFYVRLVRSGQ